MTDHHNHVSAATDYAEALRLVRQHMKPGDTLGTMFMRVAKALEVIPNDAKATEEWVEVTDGTTKEGDRFSYIGNSETGVGQITSHKRRVQRSSAANEDAGCGAAVITPWAVDEPSAGSLDETYPDAAMVCAELYQVLGYLAHHYGVMEHPDIQKALDNASQHKLVHTDLLPWPKQDLPAVPQEVRIRELTEQRDEAVRMRKHWYQEAKRAAAPIPNALPQAAPVTDEQIEIACEAYADATNYYVKFHRGLSSPSADHMRKGMRAALSSLSRPQSK